MTDKKDDHHVHKGTMFAVVLHMQEDEGDPDGPPHVHAIGPIPPLQHLVEAYENADCPCDKFAVPMYIPEEMMPPDIGAAFDALNALENAPTEEGLRVLVVRLSDLRKRRSERKRKDEPIH